MNSIEEVVSRGKNCLLVKLLTTMYYNGEAFNATMKKVWCHAKTLQFYEMGEGLVLVEFENCNDKLRVVRDGP